MNVVCIHCNGHFDMDDTVAGKVVECPACSELFRVQGSADSRRLCPNCAADMGETSVICVACGFNYESGEFMRTIISEEKEELPLWHKCLNVVADTIPGLFKPMIVLTAIICFVISQFLMSFGLFLLLGLQVALTGTVVTAFGLIVYAQSISLMLSGTFERMSQAMVDYEPVHWWIFLTLVFGPFLAILMFFIYYGPKLAAQ